MSAYRLIWHLDIDSFFVSAERLQNPALRNIPVAVGANNARSVISSASYEARQFGVRSAMPTALALKKCPQLVLCPPNFELYSHLSTQVFSLLDAYTPTWESVSIDEAYLDMTGTESLFGPPEAAAESLRAHISKNTGLTASIGMGSNRLIAKIATDFCKPNNSYQVKPGDEKLFLAPLEVGRIPGVGRVTQKWLHDRGIISIAQLQNYPVEILEKHLGQFGVHLHQAAHGIGDTEFHEQAKNPSISREITFSQDQSNPDELAQIIAHMATELGRELRSRHTYARSIKLKLRYPPFHTLTRSRVLDVPTQTDHDLIVAANTLFHDHWEPHTPLRLVGVGCTLGEGSYQLGLFESPQARHSEKQEKLDRLRDELTNRFGPNALKSGWELK